MIRHALAEGWELVRGRTLVSLFLAIALAVPICLAGLTFSVSRWLRPMVALAGERSVVAVLLHPETDSTERTQWMADQAREHPDWTIDAVPSEQLVERLTRWFPYLADVLGQEAGDLLPPLVEIGTDDPDQVVALLSNPTVIAVGPRSSLPRLIGRVTERLAGTLLAVSLVLLGAAALLAAVWVHLELYRHGDEITIMRLLGATEGAIRGPFLFAVLAPGTLAAALASTGTAVLSSVLSRLAAVVGLPPLVATWQLLSVEAVLACALPLAAACGTLWRHAGTGLDVD